jgi:hypothetical protein
MLYFYPTTAPHDLVFFGMTYGMPQGQFYLRALETVPRTILPWSFVINTDTFGYPVLIHDNDQHIATVLPKGGLEKVDLYLAPGLNFLKCENGIDPPVNLLVAATHFGALLYIFAKEHYEYAGRIVDQYTAAISSPWNTFFAEWLLPWRRELPNVQTLRVLGVKSAALCMYNQSGRQGGVTDLVSGLALTTPAIENFKNPLVWQPDLYQPHTSSEDITGFGFHIWTPNTCMTRWSAFLKYIENAPQYEFTRVSEHVVGIRTPALPWYEQHLFGPEAIICSPLGLLTAIGCQDNLTITGTMKFTTHGAFCAWTEPVDLTVEFPGIGGGYFDTTTPWDSTDTFDTVYDLDLLTDGWSGTNLAKHYDFGSCPDLYSQVVHAPEDALCCEMGPDCKVLATQRTDADVISAVTPIHPLFGGGEAGELLNPYFATTY